MSERPPVGSSSACSCDEVELGQVQLGKSRDREAAGVRHREVACVGHGQVTRVRQRQVARVRQREATQVGHREVARVRRGQVTRVGDGQVTRLRDLWQRGESRHLAAEQRGETELVERSERDSYRSVVGDQTGVVGADLEGTITADDASARRGFPAWGCHRVLAECAHDGDLLVADHRELGGVDPGDGLESSVVDRDIAFVAGELSAGRDVDGVGRCPADPAAGLGEVLATRTRRTRSRGERGHDSHSHSDNRGTSYPCSSPSVLFRGRPRVTHHHRRCHIPPLCGNRVPPKAPLWPRRISLCVQDERVIPDRVTPGRHKFTCSGQIAQGLRCGWRGRREGAEAGSPQPGEPSDQRRCASPIRGVVGTRRVGRTHRASGPRMRHGGPVTRRDGER